MDVGDCRHSLAFHAITLISQRATTLRRQRSRLIVYCASLSLLFLFNFYSSGNLSRYLFDFRTFFTETRVMSQGLKISRQVSNILVTYFTGCKKPLKMHFFKFFSLGDLTFSTTAQKRFELGENRQRTNHRTMIGALTTLVIASRDCPSLVNQYF